MLPDRMVLSAYIDGEVPGEFRDRIERSIQDNESVRREYEELKDLRRALLDAPMPDVSSSAVRSWMHVSHRMIAPSHGQRRARLVRLPMPAVAAAAAVFVAAVAIMVWSFVRAGAATTAEDYLASGRDVDVTISVEGSQMESVLEWLASQNMLGEVNIQLPEEHEFTIVGEPVFVKPADYGGNIIP